VNELSTDMQMLQKNALLRAAFTDKLCGEGEEA
jgi:hypothetical protein